MKLLVTAGNTQTPVDQVRCLTNIFSGKTGARIAAAAAARGHAAHLLTSHPEALEAVLAETGSPARPTVETYRTFDDLRQQLEKQVRERGYDALVHAAAVSDYAVAGIYAPAEGSFYDPNASVWSAGARLDNAAAGKIGGSQKELWLRLTPTPKLVDLVKSTWGFRGLLVKFKLEVGKTDAELKALAETARVQSAADLLVANTLEDKENWALMGPLKEGYAKIPRGELAGRLLDRLGEMVGRV